MRVDGDKAIIQDKEINILLQLCVRTFRFYNKNKIPDKIVVAQPKSFKFKADHSSEEIEIPVEWKSDTEEQDNVTDGHSGTSRNRKATRPVSTSNQNKLESDK